MKKLYHQLPNLKAGHLFLFLLLNFNLFAQTTRYVKQGGTGNGSSWAQASGDIQAMINASAWGDPVWVAAGTYSRTSGLSYSLKSGIKLYGGFPATGTPVTGDRNAAANVTILKANGARVMLNADIDNNALMDGFTLQDGALTGGDNGGAILNSNSSPTISNCIFKNNSAVNWGGAIYNTGVDTHAKFVNCLFYGNSASGGGAIFDHNYSTPVYINCTVTGNTSTQNGGGIHTYENAVATLNNCIVWNNHAQSAGDELFSIGSNTSVTANYSLIANDTNDISGTFNGSQTIYSDPLFATGVYTLQACSPALNAGSNTYLSGFTTDLGNNARFYSSGTADIGAYEYQGSPLAAPTATTPQNLASDSTVANLTATGTGLKWYSAQTGGTALATSTVLAAGTYYVSQTVGCESTRTAVVVTLYTTIRYVKPSATGTGDGTTWANASTDIQAMINTASVQEVWVAAGTYKPATLAGNGATDRDKAFVLKNNVKVYGGFAGTETTLAERNWNTNVTILSGDLGTAGNSSDNAYHVVISAGAVGTAELNGFTITGGKADGGTSITVNTLGINRGNGAGICTSTSSPALVNLIVEGNTCSSFGGGVYSVLNSSPKFTNVVISGNTTTSLGGGAFITGSTATFTNCTISGNNKSGIWSNASTAGLILRNTIVYGNEDGIGNGSATRNNSLVQGMTDTSNGNIADIDPMFANAPAYTTAPFTGADYRLLACSNVLNLGNNTYVSGITTDLGGNPRIYNNGTVDMGAYEYQAAPSVTPAPTASPQTFCGTPTAADLVATGTAPKWYTAVTGGTALSTSTALATGTYYVSQTIVGCESTRTSVSVTVNPLPVAPTASAQSFCGNATVANLTVTGTAPKWYSASTGGTALATTAALATNTYYVTQTVNGCESTRTAVSITVNAIPAAPTASTQAFCGSATVANLTATGNSLQWYTVSTGGTALAAATALSTNTYYVSQTVNGCESPRTTVSVTVNPVPAVPTANAQAFCGSATVANLIVTGTAPKWYTASTGGTALATSAALATNTYYVSQTVSGCESERTAVSVTVNPIPAAPTASAQTFCGTTTVANLTATGTALKWYTASAGGSALASNANVTTGTRYVSQTVNGCESPRTAVSVTVNSIPAMPTAATPQNVAPGTTLAGLTVTGSNLQWYSAATGGTLLSPDAVLSSGTYYVSQTINGCEGPRTAVVVALYTAIRYVKTTPSGSGDGTSWENASADIQAMINAYNTEQVWVAAGTYKTSVFAGDGTGDRDKAFVMKNNIKIYGGFSGSETALDERDWNTNITILSGDLGIENDNSDNAYHVVISFGEMGTAALDGFTITGGNANGEGYVSMSSNYIVTQVAGGGIHILNSSPVISNVVINNNSATYGGAISAQLNSSPILTNLLITGNACTYSSGGIIYDLNNSSPVVSNSRISGNTGTAIANSSSSSPILTNVLISGNTGVGFFASFDCLPVLNNVTISGNAMHGIACTQSLITLKNTVVSGNIFGINGDANFAAYNSLIQGINDTTNGNINGVVNDPLFTNAPLYSTAPFAGGDYSLQACSQIINKGNNDYATGIATDLAGNPRIYNGVTVDIGAYEYQGTGLAQPAAPTLASPQNVVYHTTAANWIPGANNLKWYYNETGGTAIAPDFPIEYESTYYVTQTVNGCESLRIPIAVTLSYPIRYVRANGGGNGTTWATASSNIQTMINTPGVQQVCVAAGTYQPSFGQSFSMKEGVKIYGGFAPTGSPAFTDRNWQANPTILQGNNGSVIMNIMNGLTNAALLDGFIITGGNGTSGGGIRNVGVRPVIANCIFRNNTATTFGGGGIYNNGGGPVIVNSLFYNNTGGAAYDSGSATTKYYNVTIANNYSNQFSGGIYSAIGSIVTGYNCIIWGNTNGSGSGRQLTSVDGASITMNNSVILNNATEISGPFTGNSIIGADPLFADAAQGNFALQGCSLAINAGSNSYLPSGITTDLYANPRQFNSSTVDMGAYEYQAAQNAPAAPTAPAPQAFDIGTTVAGLAATGNSLQWYTVGAGGTPLAPDTMLTTGTYYVSQTVNGCESPRTVVAVTIASYPIAYVKPVASGNGNGRSWENASDNIQAMINRLGVEQVWVAQGTYKPAVMAGNGPTDRDKAFVMKNNVKVYGGFTGTETALNERNWTNNITTLSGDLGTENNISDNAYHVVISAGGTGTAELNGFTVTGGNANGTGSISVNGQNVLQIAGGGIYNDHSSPAFNNAAINNNSATYGGGIYNNTSSPVFNNVAVNYNISTDIGGGMYNSQSSPVLTAATISGNTGSGMELGSYSSPILTNVTISGNTGDGIKTANNCYTILNNVVVSGNAGHGINNSGTVAIYLTVNNATISGNGNYGIYFSSSSSGTTLTLANSIVYGNGNGISTVTTSSLNSLVQGIANSANANINGITNPAFTDAPAYTTAPFTGGDYRLMACSPILNMGDNDYAASWTVDIAGNPRIYNGGIVDPGAYEYQGIGTPTAAPTAATPQEFSIGSILTVANLTATGTNLKWYRAETGNTPLAAGTTLSEGKYYVSQTIGGCESLLTEVSVAINYPPIVYVKPVATGTGSGTSWENASGDLQAMINASGVQQVWVAAGTHKPLVKAGNGATERNKAFVLKNNVKVYGGFTGTETALEQRDWEANITTLSGDLGIENDASDNAYHVVISAGNVGSAVLDGFTLTGANGGNSPSIIVNNEYIDGLAGGGMYIYNSSPGLANLTISNNNSTYGGAIYNYLSSYLFSNATISNNTAEHGSGIYSDESVATITNGTISNNNSEGIYNGYNSSSVLMNVSISGNGTEGVHNEDYASLVLTNVTISGNGSYGIYNGYDTNLLLKNTIVYDNQSGIYNANTTPTYHNSLVQGINDPSEGNFSGLIDPLFVNAPSYTTAPFSGGDYSLQACSPMLNHGNNDYVADITTDVAGNPRIYNNGIVDLGAYEYQNAPSAGSIAPVAVAQNFDPGATVANLVATGTNIKWYDSIAGGTLLAPSTQLMSATYYASQTIDGCESPRTAVAVTVNFPTTRYVKATASGTGDGTSWVNASGSLQAMVNALGVQQVWVAAGQYQPTAGQSFTMKPNVAIYGGFPASGTPGMVSRNVKLYPTILAGNGNRVIENNANGLTGTAVLDGFIIQNGSASDNGGGMRNINSYPSVRNCIFRNNMAGNWGGAMLNQGNGSVTITNCLFYNNQSTGGGANFDYLNAQTIYTNVTFANNISTVNGGAVHTYQGASSKFYNCIFYGNTAQQQGAQIISAGGSAAVYNCMIEAGSNSVSGPFTSNDPVAGTPLFTDPANGDYTLQSSSPGVDAGNVSYFANAATSTDLSGSARIYGGAIDLGPYEYKEFCSITTMWDGSTWSNGAPVSYEYSVVINGDYNSLEDGGITACSLIVATGDVVITEGDNFTVKGAVTVDDENASLTVQHNANLLQIDGVDNVGTITVIKESAPMYRLDYALWASPVAGQKLKAFSPQTLDNRFYSYNPLSDAYATVQAPAATDFTEAKSYLIRVSNTHPAYVSDDIAPTPWEGTFIGVPNNGNVNIPVTGMADGINGYNGVGNPYPSSINIKAFFEANQNNLAEDTPIYFWRKKNDANTSSYCSLTLAGYNQNSGNAFGDSSNGLFDDPDDSENWVINPGQGFIVQAAGSTVTFNNTMRVAVNNGQMFRSAMDVSDKSRLWLNLTNADGAFGQATIAYTPFTTLGRDFGWDGKALTDGDIAIYSLAGENKFGIQARPAFDPADEVPMEFKVTLAGNYTISLDHFDGVFAEGQEIYLRDNVLGVTHNLQSPYEFTTDAGIITGRFDVVYAEALGTDIPAFNSNSIIVYKQGSSINISTGNVDMKSVSVYDIRGRLLYSADNINSAATSITTLQAQEEMLIVEVTTIEGVKAGRKIVF